MFSSSHLPRSTGDVRLPYDVTVRIAALPEQPAAPVVVERHAPEPAAVDAGNPIVPRQPLVEERVVGASAARATLRSSRSWLSRNSSVSRWNASRRFSSNSGKHVRIGRLAAHGAQLQPLAEEIVDQRLRARRRPASAAPAARAPPDPSACPAPPASSSSSSGMLLHRKNDSRDASSRSLRPDRSRPPRAPAGSRSMRNRNSGSTSMRSSADWMPPSKPLPRAPSR